MTAKFSMCLATVRRAPEERRELFRSLAASASAVMAPPVWAMRVRGTEVVQGAWNDSPIDVPDGWAVCLYPQPRSSMNGAWLIERIEDTDVWTLSLPVTLLKTQSDNVLDALWKMGDVSVPCIAGEEYSMAAVLSSGSDVLLEAGGTRSLATYAVVRKAVALKDWAVMKVEGDRILLARKHS